MRNRAATAAVAGSCLGAAISFIYYEAAASYLFNDDFHWFQEARRFDAANLAPWDRYNHFYRPVIEIYFYAGARLFGCAALPFHIASIGIHLLNTLLLFLFARGLAGRSSFAFLAALLFCVQPGYVEAVAWIAAITDLLPAVWYLLTLLMHLHFLQGRGTRFYLVSLATFAACLLTHESSATLLAMMVALEATLVLEGSAAKPGARGLRRGAMRYAPFALLLAGSLVIAYVVNMRSYLVKEGHYGFGWHAVPNMVHYVIALAVWKRMLVAYVVIGLAIATLLLRGTPRVRFFVAWIVITLAPASFFTWGIASRYLYVPAAGFALLLAAALIAIHDGAAERFSRRTARACAAVLAAVLSVRFALFAHEGSEDFRERTRPYERLVAAVRRSDPSPAAGAVVEVDPRDLEDIPALYVEPAVQTAYCRGDVRATVR